MRAIYNLVDSPYVVVSCPTCHVCGNSSEMQLLAADVQRWLYDGEYVQTVFPWMTPSNREVLVSGTHPHCWDAMFGDEGDEGDDDATPEQ